MQLPAGNANCFGYLDVAGGTTAIILAIEKNSVGVGTITFAAGSGHNGVFSIAANVDFVEGDRYALRATQSNNAGPSGMSITLPFVRKDSLIRGQHNSVFGRSLTRFIKFARGGLAVEFLDGNS